jgi:hypothetical protein
VEEDRRESLRIEDRVIRSILDPRSSILDSVSSIFYLLSSIFYLVYYIGVSAGLTWAVNRGAKIGDRLN